MHPKDPVADELPDELAELAAEQLLGVAEPRRTAVLAALIATHAQHAAGLLRLGAELAAADRLLDGIPDSAPIPTQVGGHRVQRVLGEGAFGVVYLCAQEQPVVRPVAVKVLRPGVGDDKTLRRFAAERQLLATLNHPAITQVFDAGVMADGRPFFVMEYVEGLPLCRYCDTHQLSCEARLRLFVELCRGVAHAHSRRIVHRDLKPANVLVLDTDDGPMPKIIDFGIAKALFASQAGSEGGEGPRTDAGRVIGTPGYMSPEQAAGRNAEVDERADVFALGVMLYELLTGHMPWAEGAAATDTEPVRPSARVTTATVVSPSQSSQRRALAAELRGDLDWITLKALNREREQRYETVAALMADLERHLRGETVSVGPPSLRYRLHKFVRRNRSLVATVVGALVVLGIGLGGALAYGSSAGAEAAEANAAAEASFADSMAVVERLLARANDPQLVDAPKSDGARQALLQDALSFYDRFLLSRPLDPDLRGRRCQALLSISQVHVLLGEMSRAEAVAAVATEEARSLFDAAPDHVDSRGLLAEGLRKQGRARAMAGDHAAAQPMLAAAVEHLAICAAIAPETYGRSHAAVLREAAETLDTSVAESGLAGLQQSLAVVDGLCRDHAQIPGLVDEHVQACTAVAIQLLFLGRLEEAKSMLATAEADLPLITAEHSLCTLRIRQQQGHCAWRLGNRPLAIQYLQAAVEAADVWLREQPQRLQPQDFLARTLRDLGAFQNYVGAFAESNVAFRRAVLQADLMVQRFPEDSSRLASLCKVLRMFAQTLWDRFRIEDLEEAAACAARATAINDRIPPNVGVGRQPRWLLLAVEAGIAEAYGHDASAIWHAVEADAPDPATCKREHSPFLSVAFVGLARWACHRGEAEAARHWLAFTRRAIESQKPDLDKLWVDVGWIEAQLAVAAGDPAEAAAAADRILAARNTWFAKQRAGDCMFAAWRGAAALPSPDPTLLQRYRDEAIKLYGAVLDTLRGDVGEPLDPWYVLPWGWASLRTAQLRDAAGDGESAKQLLQTALPKLEGVQATAHVDQWDAVLFEEGRALRERLTRDHR